MSPYDTNKRKEKAIDSGVTDKEDFLQSKPLYRWLLLGLLFALALGIRVYRINDPPLEFNSSRQYQCALLARYYYYMVDPSASDWQREMAKAQKPLNYEPPIMEKAASQFYQIKDAESLWFPRLLSVIFWLAAGVGIYFLSKRLWSETAGVFSVTVFLFLPYGIFASRSFTPDPPMVTLMVYAFLAMVIYFEKPTLLGLAVAGILAAAAIFVKVQCIFMVLFAFGALMLSRKKVREAITNLHLWIFIFTALAPGAIYYSYGLFITKSFQAQAQKMSFVPSLLASPIFYRGWLQNVGLMVGFSLIFITILALPLSCPRKTPRALLMGLWVGYFVFSLAFNRHTCTHHYYQLQIFPLVALSVGYIGALVFGRLNNPQISWKFRAAVMAILLIALSLDGIKHVIIRRHWLESNMDFKKIVEVAKEIGQHVDHSAKCIFLDPEFGAPLKYHGWMAGWIWYDAWGISFRRRFLGEDETSAQELYSKKYAIHDPEFFIVTDLKEFDRQDNLKEFLKTSFPIVASTSHYLIFDTTRERK